jgi:hypothetical protein
MIATRPRLIAAAAIAMAVVGARTPLAHAQSAEAEILFRDAKRLMKSGKIADACDKFDASERLEPTVGTELNLADCREKNGQLATAWALFLKAAAAAKRADNDGKREAESRRRAAALEPRLVYLTISVPAASRVDGLVLKRNGTAIDPVLWDQRVPVDPDEYTIVGAAPGFEPWSTSVAVKTKPRTVEVPALTRRPGALRVAAPAQVEPPAAVPARFTGRRKLAIAIAAVGVGAAGVSIGFGLQASSVEDQADAICPNAACNNAHAVDLNRVARRDALVANIGLVTAAAAAITAAVLWYIGSPNPSEGISIAPMLGRDRAGLSFGRAF